MSEYLILSDTHDNLDSIRKLVELLGEGRVLTRANEVKLIHLGDFVSPFTLRMLLEHFHLVAAVFGNNDGDKVLLRELAPQIFDQPQEIKLSDFRVLLLHGFKSPKMTLETVNSLAAAGSYDIVLYGHTHTHDVRVVGNGVLVFNPGTLSGYLSNTQTFGLLDLEMRKARVLDLQGRVIEERSF